MGAQYTFLSDGSFAVNTMPAQIKVREIVVADNVAKRDTATITSGWFPIEGFSMKRLLYYTNLNQAIDIKVYVSFDGGITSRYAGKVSPVATAGFAAVSETGSIDGLKMLKGHMKIDIEFPTAPTSGVVDVRLQIAP